MATFESLSALRARVGSNLRLRLGLWLIVAIVWVYGLLLLRDETALAVGEHRAVVRKLSRIQAQSTQTEWIARAAGARSAQLELESRLWRESTVGLAQAAFQDWLNQAIQQANLTRASVSAAAQDENVPDKNAASSPDPAAVAGFWKVTARVGFDFTPKGLYALLGRIEGHDKQIIVESLVVRTTPAPRAEMTLVAYFQKPAGPTQAVEPRDNGPRTAAAPAFPPAAPRNLP